MSGRRALQAASQLGSRLSLQLGLRSISAGLGAAQGTTGAWQSLPQAHPYSAEAAPDATVQQEDGRPVSGSRERGGDRWRPSAARRGDAQQTPPRMRRELWIPRQWEFQGRADLGNPLVQELRALLDGGDASAARKAFEAALAPLEAALARGEAPPADELPPPYAWKLYFTALSAMPTHAHRYSDVLDRMKELGVAPQVACFVLALRQMARQGLGHVAVTKLHQMADQGLPPTLRCYMFAIEACLRGQPPEHGYAKKLLEQVAEQELAVYPTQKAELGKLIMHAVRDFARYRRFAGAMGLLDQLEGLGLRVPAFLVADVMHMATLARAEDALLECVRRLERMTQTFQEVPGVGEPVTRPLKVEEGLLLAVMEVAANKANVELAEATWQVLDRSVALPNPPSTGGALSIHLGRADALQRHADKDAAAAAAGDEDEEAAAAGDAAAQEGAQQQAELLSNELEAIDAAAAEAAEAQASRKSHRWGQRQQRDAPNARALAEATAMAATPRGMHAPSVVSHLARVHAYAAGGRLASMLEAVVELVQTHPEEREAAAYYHGLPMAVDALARSEQDCDAAFFLLESWAKEGRTVLPEQMNLVVAACCQIGDLKRAFETFDSYGQMGVTPNADSYNALMQGCLESGHVDTALQVYEQLVGAGLQPTAWTHHQLVDAGVVAGNMRAMMVSLEDMQAAGHSPRLALLERCTARAERAGDRDAVRELMRLLFANDYRLVGVDAKARRWVPEGGVTMLTGSSKWFSREQVLREMRKTHSINKRISQRQQREAAPAEGHAD